jgi:hypothetical protein
VAGCNEACDLRRFAKKVLQFLLQEPIRIGHTMINARQRINKCSSSSGF